MKTPIYIEPTVLIYALLTYVLFRLFLVNLSLLVDKNKKFGGF